MDTNDIPMLDAGDPDFDKKLEFALWSTGGASDYSNDRKRPYTGQSWTDEGARGAVEVKGLTMRDIKDCLVKAMLQAGVSDKYLEFEEFQKCWDFTRADDKGNPLPTQYLLDRLDDPDFVFAKVDLGTWRTQDVYKIDFSKVDPLAIASNLTCEIEKMMGIFPNIEKPAL